jgi:hypothetical protein
VLPAVGVTPVELVFAPVETGVEIDVPGFVPPTVVVVAVPVGRVVPVLGCVEMLVGVVEVVVVEAGREPVVVVPVPVVPVEGVASSDRL